MNRLIITILACFIVACVASGADARDRRGHDGHERHYDHHHHDYDYVFPFRECYIDFDGYEVCP